MDDRKKRAASVHGVTFKRHETSPGTPVGIPPAVEAFEDEQPTPRPVDLEEAREWLHLDDRLGKVELGQQAFTQSFPRLEALVTEFLMPSFKELMAQIDGLLQRQERNSTRLELFFDEQWPALEEQVDTLVHGLARVEAKQAEFGAALALHNDRIARAEKAIDTIDLRVTIVERKIDDTALVRRAEAALRRRWWSYVVNGRNAALAGVSAITLVVARWSDVVDFFSLLGG